MAEYDDYDEHEEPRVDPDPDVRESFRGFIRSVPDLTTTSKGHPKFYAKVGQKHWRFEPDGTYTRLPNTYHDFVAYKGVAVRAYKKLQQGDHFIAEGRLEEYVSSRTGETKKRFTATGFGHDPAYTRYEVDRTPRRDAAERDAAERAPAERTPAEAETPSRETPEKRRPAADRERPAFSPPEYRPDRQSPAMGL
jgi:single-stranded DNA-binding protein